LPTVQQGDLWIADRNFCTTDFLFGIHDRKAALVIRQHSSTLSGKELIGRRRKLGRSETGVVYEQKLKIRNSKAQAPEQQVMELRRITVKLDQPTRDGETEVHIVTNIPEEQADAFRIAELYRKRWTIEYAFQELGQALRSEVNTLCYPKAALLAFCVGLYLLNILNVLKAAMRSAYRDPSLLMELSGYYLAEEISSSYRGMMIAIEPRQWTKVFAHLSTREMAQLLKQLARNVDISEFRKSKRGPKKPPPKRTGGYREKHVSTARLIAQRTAAKSAK
jgi:hypothetical protein